MLTCYLASKRLTVSLLELSRWAPVLISPFTVSVTPSLLILPLCPSSVLYLSTFPIDSRWLFSFRTPTCASCFWIWICNYSISCYIFLLHVWIYLDFELLPITCLPACLAFWICLPVWTAFLVSNLVCLKLPSHDKKLARSLTVA